MRRRKSAPLEPEAVLLAWFGLGCAILGWLL